MLQLSQNMLSQPSTGHTLLKSANVLSRWQRALLTIFLGIGCSVSLELAVATCAAETLVKLDYQVVARHPHRDTIFTQGLLIENGILYESGGLRNGRECCSSLDKIQLADLAEGNLLVSAEVPADIFAEGIAIADTQLVQLSWQAGRAFVYDKTDLKSLKEWRYQGEGWGLTYNGEHFIMSNGTSQLVWRQTDNFAVLKSVPVTINGRPLVRLNELEWIEGYIWANVWFENALVVIAPDTGKVVATLNLAALAAEAPHRHGEVLNGIAYDAATGHIWVTGKNWQTLYELSVDLAALPAR